MVSLAPDALRSSAPPVHCSLLPLACSQRVGFRKSKRFAGARWGQLLFLGRGEPRMQQARSRETSRVSCEGGSGSPAVLESSNENGEADQFRIGGDGEVGDAPVVTEDVEGEVTKDPHTAELKEVLRLCQLELEKSRENSTQVETEAQRIAERAIALRDQASVAESAVKSARALLEDQLLQEVSGKEALLKARSVLDEVKASLKSREEVGKPYSEVELETQNNSPKSQVDDAPQLEILKCEEDVRTCEAELTKIQNAKTELEMETARLSELADVAKAVAAAADEDVANAMLLAEKAVAIEVEAAQRLCDAEMALQKAESQAKDASVSVEVADSVITPVLKEDVEVNIEGTSQAALVERTETSIPASEEVPVAVEVQPSEADAIAADVSSEKEFIDILEKVKPEADHVESGKVLVGGFSRREGKDTEPAVSKSFTKKSSRFFPASFFSFDEAEEFSPSAVFSGFLSTAKTNLPKILAGGLLLLGGGLYIGGKAEKIAQLGKSFEVSLNVEEAATSARPLVKRLYKLRSSVKTVMDKLLRPEVNEEEASLLDVLWLLLASVVFVPLFQKIPGGSPVLGYLAAGVLIGPHSLHIIQNVHGTKAIAELGVVFLLFNIGLELSVERLSSMRKYVFGFGSSQVLATALATGLFVHYIARASGPAAIVIGNGLALSSTAVVLQVLQERGENTSRHGRATFSVLLFQDLAVVVLLILIPLLSPNSSKGGVGFNAIAEALGIAAIKGVIAISGIIAGGRLLLRPIYRSMAEIHNAEIFAANTLLVVLGTSLLTAKAGLSMALGAFLAGLLLAETEFALQVESDIAPYRGLLLGLFFMTVGMSIDPSLFVAKFPIIMGSLALLLCGKTFLIAMLGKQFGLSDVAAVRAGLLLAPGGEFAFVAFGEAVNQGIMSQQLSSLLFLVVGLSMAVTPYLAAAGQLIATKFEQQDVRSLLPAENEADDLEGHMIVCGFGRVGQIISQMLSERLIPFVALDVRSERVSMGRSLDLPVYFGDAGSKEVLHKLGAERAAAAVITLDTPGANYRAVWALSKYFPNVKTYVRAHDVDHGINLEKAGATAVVPETLEPSLQLAAAVLAEAKLPASEIASTINEFRTRHLAELTELTKASGTSLGYGFSQAAATPKPKEDGGNERRLSGGAAGAAGGVIAVP